MPAYLITERFADCEDQASLATYRQAVPPLIARHGGRYVTSTTQIQTLEGEGSPYFVSISEFPTMQQLRTFWDSPEYQAIAALRRSAPTRIFALEVERPHYLPKEFSAALPA